ncbi:MAG: ABC transporter permease [Nitratireductor sp.]
MPANINSEYTKTETGHGAANVAIVRNGQMVSVVASGNWVAAGIGNVDRELRDLALQASGSELQLDLSRVGRIDTFGAWIFTRLSREWRNAGGKVRVSGLKTGLSARLIEAVAREDISGQLPQYRSGGLIRMVESLGRTVFALRRDALLSFNMIGAAIRGPQLKAGKSGSVRPVSIINHMDRMGLRAVPIIALMAFLIGAIIAQQGAWSLRYFGAEFLTVDFVSILLLREVGVLLTAIMVAGRTGSAMTAEIGSMKMREEIDALQVIGLNPVGVLIFPRLVALTFVLPLLAFVANMAALVGAALVLRFYSDIAFDAFIIKLRASIDLSTVFAGLIKAPFMALVIGIMAAVEGMKVEGSAESLGRRVTAAVVKAIFFVIVIDGFFAVFYAQIDY